MPKTNQTRSPVITIMGHIDHGKTTLLDAIRQSNITEKESGGITQHIGAYQINYKNRSLTFIDTPGHAAFAGMRARGTQVTDLVILVIDAIESVKAQTKECLDHIKAAKTPFLVAINKMDLPNAVPDIVKKDLADNEVLVEGFGGDVVCVPISAKTKKGIKELLEMILLITDMLKLKNKQKDSLKAVVIESSLDRQKGPIATLIIQSGTLIIGDHLQSKNISGKVKALFNENQQPLISVVPGQPAQVLGFKSVPSVGSLVTSQLDSKNLKVGSAQEIPTQSQSVYPSEKTLKIIVKADAFGTLEAITGNLTEDITLISKGVGDITQSDVLLAQSTSAFIISFRVKTPPAIARLADTESVLIKNYQLIHELLDDLQDRVLKILEPTINEKIIGKAKITDEFTVRGKRIAGCLVELGKLTVKDKIHLMRKKTQVADSTIKAIHQGKESVDKAKKNEQCGLSFSSDLDFKPKDKLVAFTQV